MNQKLVFRLKTAAVDYHAFTRVHSAKRQFKIIIGKQSTLRMPYVLKISVRSISMPRMANWLGIETTIC